MNFILILALLWLTYWLLDLICNGRWWVWEFTSMIPSWCWPLTWLALLALATFYQDIPAVILILITLPLWLRCLDISWWGKSKRIETNGVKLFNWNTQHWLETPKDGFYEFIRSQNADIYHLQEAIHTEGVAIDVVPELQRHFPEYQIVQSGELVTMTRLPVVAVFADIELPYLRVDVQVGTKVVSAYNVHITVHIAPDHLKKSVGLFLAKIRERFTLRQREFTSLWQALEQNPLPRIVSGDFNTATSQVGIRRFLQKYQDSFAVLHQGIPTTYTFGGVLKLWRIDYVFASDDIAFMENANIDPQKLSDHHGLAVSFKHASLVESSSPAHAD